MVAKESRNSVRFPPGTPFRTAEEAGAAGVQAAEAKRVENNNDTRHEYYGRIVPLPGGGATFTAPKQAPYTTSGPNFIYRAPSTDLGWYHLHNEGNGDRLSPDDISTAKAFARFSTSGDNAVTVLGGDDGNIYSWKGQKGLNYKGKNLGKVSCK